MLEFDPKFVEGSQYDRNKQTQLSNLITFTRYRYITKHLSKHLTLCKFFPLLKQVTVLLRFMFKWPAKMVTWWPRSNWAFEKIKNLILPSPGALLPRSTLGQIAVLGFVKDHE